jgi:hypothetical protein
MRAIILRMLSSSALSAFSFGTASAGATPVSQPWTISPARGDTSSAPLQRLPAPQGSTGLSLGNPSPPAGQALRRGSLIDLSV